MNAYERERAELENNPPGYRGTLAGVALGVAGAFLVVLPWFYDQPTYEAGLLAIAGCSFLVAAQKLFRRADRMYADAWRALHNKWACPVCGGDCASANPPPVFCPRAEK